MDWQWLFVGLCVGSAAWFVARQSLRTWSGGCGGGCGCARKEPVQAGRISLPMSPSS